MTNSSTVAIAPPEAHDRLAYLPALDGLRGVAVAVVVAFHAHWLTGGYLGVDLFFVLSGFLVSGLLFAELQSRGAVSPLRFYVRRGFKIYPAFYVLVAVSVVLLPIVGWPVSAGRLLAEIFFVQNFVHIIIRDGNFGSRNQRKTASIG